MDKYRLSPEQVKKIEEIADKCDRVELIPTKDGTLKIFEVYRRNIEKHKNK